MTLLPKNMADARSRVYAGETPYSVPVVYRNFKHLQQKILPLKMSGWSKKEDKDSIVFEFFQSPYTLPKLSLSVYSGLNFSVAAYNWFLPDDHYIYSDYKRSLKHTSISTLMATLQSTQICEGLSKEEHIQ